MRIPKCPVCEYENDLSTGTSVCEKCGAFLTDRHGVRKIIEANNKRYKGDISAPMLAKENPYFIRPNAKFSSGSLALDRALYTNGFSIGSRIEIFGGESTGKTTLALQMVAELQKRNAVCLYIDMEGTLDLDWAETLGVDLDNFYVSRPNSGTQAIDIIGNYCDVYDVIVLDTVALLTRSRFVSKQSDVDSDGDVKDAQDTAGQAYLIGQLQGQHGNKITRANTTIILLNQIRENLTPAGAFGRRSPGGFPLKHFCTHKIELRRIAGNDGIIREGGDVVGFQVLARVLKNKREREGGEAILDFIYGEGFSKEREYITMGIAYGHITQSGAWYKIDGKSVAQGMEKLVMYFKENQNEFENLKKKVEESMYPKTEEQTNGK